MELLVELYKKELEVFLATIGIFEGEKRINTNEQLNNENKAWLKKKFIQLKSGNVDERI